VGAGPVGLTLAIALRRLAVDVRVVDRASQAKREQRACVIWPRALEALDDLGAAAPMTNRGIANRAQALYANGRYLGTHRFGRVLSRYPFPLNIEQHDVERMLVDQLQAHGVAVEWETTATSLNLQDDGVEVDLERADHGHETVHCPWVVGCEGTRSMVRDHMGVAFAGQRRPNLQALQINAIPKNWPYATQDDRGYFFLAPGVSVGVFPIPVGGYRFFVFAVDTEPDRKDPPSVAEMRDLIAKAAHAPDLELEPTEPLWLSRARFADRMATQLRTGRALVVGDAAHAWAPIGGHGMNTGLRGAHNLAWKLAAVVRGQAREALLDTYDQEQRAAATRVMREMRRNPIEIPLPPLGLRAFAATAPALLSFSAFQQQLELGLSDLTAHHRQSALSSGTRVGRLRCGDRVPDVTVLTRDGQRVHVHQLLSYERWTLLVRHPHNADGRARAAREAEVQRAVGRLRGPFRVVEVTPHGREAQRTFATRLTRRRGFAVLVRPDGHVGFSVTGDHLLGLSEAVTDYLGQWYLAGAQGERAVPAQAAPAPRFFSSSAEGLAYLTGARTL
jgi:2-polyprenyl-6-methoxyphenol hydroxylase-like FAD-dependent oxidoreductase